MFFLVHGSDVSTILLPPTASSESYPSRPLYGGHQSHCRPLMRAHERYASCNLFATLLTLDFNPICKYDYLVIHRHWEALPDLNLRNGIAFSFLQLFLTERNAAGTSKVDPPLRVCFLHEGSMSRSVEMHSCTWNMKYCTWIWHVSLHHIIGDSVLSVGFGGWVFLLVRVLCHRMFRHSSVFVL